VRLLIVEDEVSLARAVARGLALDGLAVDVVHNGVDALHQATETDYDAILLDVMLPGLSGHEVLRQLRARSVWSPVLMLTARDGDSAIADALDLGADDYLVKPFSHVVLSARLRALVRRTPGPRPACIVAGRLEIDPGSREVRRDGSPVDVTSRQFALLEYLARRPGQVVSKSELLAHVWDENAEPNPNLVEVFVGALRKRLGQDVIQTVRGAGYRFPV
jgi:DNA-binding response OmpR family regulator